MTNRRQFLAGLLATGLAPSPTWADAGSPSYLSAAALPEGGYVLCGIGAQGDVLFQIPLPDRGHAAAAHPSRPEAVAFARRPGTFAVVIDCINGKPKAVMTAPEGRHFYGHGAFSKDGNWLYTTENDYEAGAGCIGVWDVRAGYIRIDEFASGGIGPHEIKRMPGQDVLVVANGGIDTHPDSGRTKLNIATMAPNLAYVSEGGLLEIAQLPHDMHKNSIRHIDIAPDGRVGFGMQWQGDGEPAALVGLHQRGADIQLLAGPAERQRVMQGYVGSVAFDHSATKVGVTSPRGGVVQIFDVAAGAFEQEFVISDAGGIAAHRDGFIVTTGHGELGQVTNDQLSLGVRRPLAWDNHVVPIKV